MLKKYKQNLQVIGNGIFSYGKKVATIDFDKKELIELGKWSKTTTKHVNYVLKELNLKKIN